MRDDEVAGELLREARQGAGLTQRELAARSGVTEEVVTACEDGRRQPSVALLVRLLRAAGADMTTRPRWDSMRNGEHFALVMEMTDVLPQRPRGPLEFPSMMSVGR